MQLEKLNKLQGLKEKVKMYVPSDVAGKKDFKLQNEMVEKTEKSFSKIFGGATSYETFGSYVMNDDSLVREKIIIIESFTSELNNDHIDIILTLAEIIKKDMQQESVSLEINGKMYFI